MYSDREQYDEEPVNPTGGGREKLVVELCNRKKPYAQIAKEAYISLWSEGHHIIDTSVG